MTAMQPQIIGNHKVIPETPKNFRNFFKTLQEWVNNSGGAYDLMNLAKKIAMCTGNVKLGETLGGYTAVSAIPRLPAASVELYETLQRTKNNEMTALLGCKVAHDVCETGAMALFTYSIFNPASSAAGNAGSTLSAMSDVVDVGTYSMEAKQSQDFYSAVKGSKSIELMSSLKAKRDYSLIKLAKAVCSAVTGVFSAYALATGVVLLGGTAAIALGLASSIFNVLAYYQKNCFSHYFAKVEALTA